MLAFKTAEAAGSKIAKERVTLLLACNMNGSEKLEPLTIGKSCNPRCFKNVKRLPVDYEANKNSWMSNDIWSKWLKKVDNVMRKRKRNIVMLCDNCAAHGDNVRLTNVKLVYLPPNTTSLIQPMDQGIIANFKRHYRSLVLRQLMTTIDQDNESSTHASELAKKLTLLYSLHMVKEAWSRVTTETVVNCYRWASFVKDDGAGEPASAVTEDDTNEAAIDLPIGVTADEFSDYVAIDNDLPVAADSTDNEICACVQEAADNGESDEEAASMPGPEDESSETATFADAVGSLRVLRAYLETSGCQNYERFYELSDQIYELNRKNSVQKTIKDFFRDFIVFTFSLSNDCTCILLAV